MIDKFGTASPQMQDALQALAGIEKLRVNEKLQEIATSLGDMATAGAWFDGDGDDLGKFLGIYDEMGSILGATRDQAYATRNAFAESISVLESAIDPAERYRAALDLSAQLEAATGGLANMTAEQRALYEGLQNIIVQSELLGVNVAVAGAEFETTASSADVLNSIVLTIAENLGIAGSMDLSGVFARAQGGASALLGTVNGIIGRMATMAQYASFAANQVAVRSGPDERGSQRGVARDVAVYNTDIRLKELGIGRNGYRLPASSGNGGGGGVGGGGGASTARAEADAVGDLIAKQERELEILRETDPVQKELIRMRDQLKGATEAERQKVEELIATRLREADIAKSMSELWDFAGDAAYDTLSGIILQGETAGEVLNNLVKSIVQAGLQALSLGKSPLAGLFGTAGTSIVDLFVGKSAAAPVAAAQKGLSIATALPRAMAAQAAVQSQPANQGNAPGGVREIRVIIDGARGNREIEDAVRAGVSADIKTYDREALPGRVRAVSGSGRRVG